MRESSSYSPPNFVTKRFPGEIVKQCMQSSKALLYCLIDSNSTFPIVPSQVGSFPNNWLYSLVDFRIQAELELHMHQMCFVHTFLLSICPTLAFKLLKDL